MLLKTNAAIWFNKICATKQLTSKYFNIKINGNNRLNRNTKKKKKSVIIWQLIVHLLVVVQNNKRCTVQVLKYCRLFLFQVGAIRQRSGFRTTE